MDIGLLTLGDHRADPATGRRTSQAERHRNMLDYLDRAEPAGFDAAFVGELVGCEEGFAQWKMSGAQLSATCIYAQELFAEHTVPETECRG